LTPPEIVLVGVDWRPRALIRAQLLEQGYEVVAVEDWSTARQFLRANPGVRMLIVDLDELEDPMSVLHDIERVMEPRQVLVLGALGTVAPADVESMGFRALYRPFAIGDVVTAAARHAGAPNASKAGDGGNGA
jgi:DNA-binding NtrC family response regulator